VDNVRSTYDNTPRISFIPAPEAILCPVDNLSTRSLHVYELAESREKKWIVSGHLGIAIRH
jgi:hypothetical protein